MSQKQALEESLRALDKQYHDVIAYAEKHRTDQIDRINRSAAECRQKIECDYRNKRDLINEQLYKLKAQAIINRNANRNELKNAENDAGKSMVKTEHTDIIASSNSDTNTNNSLNEKTKSIKTENANKKRKREDLSKIKDGESDSSDDCQILKAPPNKKQKANKHNDTSQRISTKCKQTTPKRRILIKRENDESSATDSESHSESNYDHSHHNTSKFKQRSHNQKERNCRKRARRPSVEDSDFDSEYTPTTVNRPLRRTKKHSKPDKSSRTPKIKLNTYYTNKHNQAIRARARFDDLPKNKNGQTIIQLPISTVCTEYTKNVVFVTHFGQIPRDSAKAEKYCDKSLFYFYMLFDPP